MDKLSGYMRIMCMGCLQGNMYFQRKINHSSHVCCMMPGVIVVMQICISCKEHLLGLTPKRINQLGIFCILGTD